MVRVLCALVLAGAALAMAASPAWATVTGGCTATGTSTSGGPIDLTTASVWHVQTSDRIRLEGSAPTPQTEVTVAASAFGFEIPLGSGSVDGETSARSEEFEVATLAVLGRTFLISGRSSGPAGSCAGQVLVIIDDANPLATALGGGGLAATLIGLVLVAVATRDPIPLIRRGIGILGFTLVGAGVVLVLQQALPASQAALGPGPGPGEFGPLPRSPFASGASLFVDSVVAPAQASFDPVFVAQAAILTLLVLVLLPFPSQLFNSTLSENWDEIRGALRRLVPRRRAAPAAPASAWPAASIPPSPSIPPSIPPPPAPRAWWRQPLIVCFVLVAGLLYGLLDPTFGLDERSAVTYAGLVVGLLVVTWLADLPRRALHRRIANDRGRLWVIPATLLVAAICVLISRLVGYLPGYLYGLIIGYAFAVKIPPDQEGRAGALAAWWMLALSFVAWLTLGAVRTPGVQDTVPGAVVEAVLAAIVVAGVEGVVFALMPLRFLPGELAFRWQRVNWVLLYGLGLFGFAFIFLNPANGYLPPQDAVAFPVALLLFVGFGVASILFWSYFRFRPKRAPAT